MADRPTSVITSTTCSHRQRLGQHRGGLLEPGGAQRRGRQLLGQPAAHLLGLALAGDVGAGAHPLDDLAVPLDRHRAHVVVPVGPGLGAHPVAAVEHLARRGRTRASPAPPAPGPRGGWRPASRCPGTPPGVWPVIQRHSGRVFRDLSRWAWSPRPPARPPAPASGTAPRCGAPLPRGCFMVTSTAISATPAMLPSGVVRRGPGERPVPVITGPVVTGAGRRRAGWRRAGWRRAGWCRWPRRALIPPPGPRWPRLG